MKTRVLTAIALIPIVLAAVFVAHPLPLGVLLILVTWIASSEIGNVASEKGRKPFAGLILIVAIVALLTFSNTTSSPSIGKLGLLLAPLFAVFACAGALVLNSQSPQRASRIQVELSSLWVAAPLCSLLLLHSSAYSDHLWNWKSLVLVPLFALWAGDSAAIFAGKLFGKHLLAPKISPKKTVEGAIANLIFCVLGGMLGGYIAGFPLAWSAGCGVAAGILGQAGDLFQSAWKRRFDKKDSGSLLPGHGGILDRIDSLLFTAPIVAVIIELYFWLGSVAN